MSDAERRDRTSLLGAVAEAARREAKALAEAYAAAGTRVREPLARADAELLGPAAIASFVRRLAEARGNQSLKRVRRDWQGRPIFTARSTFGDVVSRPGTRLAVVLEKGAALVTNERNEGAPALAFSDARSPALAVNLALSAAIVAGAKTTLVVSSPAVADVASRVLAPLEDKGLATVKRGEVADAIEAGREAGAKRVLATTSRANLAALEGIAGEPVSGFATDVPSTFAVAPFLYDKSEVRRLARQVATELWAPICGTRGVEVVVSRTWAQRAFFGEILAKELAAAGCEARVRFVRKDGASPGDGDPEIAIVELDSDDAAEFFTLATTHLHDERTSSEPAARARDPRAWLVSVFAHPMELEQRAFADRLDAFVAGLPASTIAINARASLTYLDGRVPVGRPGLGVQNALGIGSCDRTLFEVPLRWSPSEIGKGAEKRARYEQAPSLSRAAGLGLRAFF